MGFNTVLAPFISPSRQQKHVDTVTNENVVLLDGGFGTTLEQVFNKDVSHPLWSSRFVDEEEDAIMAAHLAFLEAGSQVILTSTYQEAYETFRRAGYSDSDAERLMVKSVDLADRAIQTYMKKPPAVGDSAKKSRPKIALSLGPYGSTMEVAAEFTGIYPPPHGPSASSIATGAGGGAGPFSSSSEELSYIDALAAFHFSRLLVYARNPTVWNKIDIVAFETVPLLTEAKAIRIAVGKLTDWLAESVVSNQDNNGNFPPKMKPWYISFVFTGSEGEFPQRCLRESMRRPLTPYEIVKGVFATTSEDTYGRQMAISDGIGINCTSIQCIEKIVREMADAIRDIQIDKPDLTLPWLVLCPNGGAEYDTVNKVWIKEDGNSLKQDKKHWRDTYTALIRSRDIAGGCFGGLVLGGCCNVAPEDIKNLRNAMLVL